jgi:hypothetical protein
VKAFLGVISFMRLLQAGSFCVCNFRRSCRRFGVVVSLVVTFVDGDTLRALKVTRYVQDALKTNVRKLCLRLVFDGWLSIIALLRGLT